VSSTTVSIAVLFTDLVGSTDLLSRIGPVAAEQIRRDHFATLRDAVAAHGGTEVKTLGDGLMVTFPSATNAIGGAVALQQAVELANRTAVEPLGMRVAVAFGDAEIEGGDYFGPSVVEAARLCARADAGQILTTDLVRALVGARGGHRFDPLGSLTLKGIDIPVSTHTVGWTPIEAPPGSSVPLPLRLDQRSTLPFTGRKQEGEILLRALKETAGSSRCRAVLVSGEAGVGKTTLVSEFARCAVHEAIVLYGRSDEELAVPYQPWTEALRHLVQHADEQVLRDHVAERGGELARLVPDLGHRVADLPAPQPSDADAERYLLYGAVVSLLARVSTLVPVIVVLDDLHWAGKPSLQLLRHVVAAGEPMRVLIVSTHRDHDLGVDSPLPDLLAKFHRDPSVQRIALSGLKDTDVIEIFEVASGSPVDEEGASVARSIQRETDGNPFFVTELVRHLAETGAFFQDADGRWRADRSLRDAGRLPSSVREVIGQRIARLGEAAERTLRAAAVIGREFGLELLVAVTDANEDALLDVLDRARIAGIVTESEVGGTFMFSHALIEHTLYEDLGPTRRQRLHLRVAEAIEDQCGHVPGRRVGELAYHYALATVPARASKAFDYARQAGDRALDELAPDEAVRWYSQALELLAAGDDQRRGPLLVALGIAQRQAGDARFRATLLDAAGIAQRTGDAALLVKAALANNRGTVSAVLTVDDDRVRVLEAALDAVDPAPSSDRARLLALLGVECIHQQDHVPPQRYAREAIAMARELGDPLTFVFVAHLACPPLLTPDNLVERLGITAEAVRVAETIGDPALRFAASFDRALTAAEAADVSEVERYVQLAQAMAAQIADPNLLYFAATLRAARDLFAGRFAEAEATIAEILEIGTRSNQPDVLRMWGGFLFIMRRDQGRTEEFLDTLTGMLTTANQVNDPRDHARLALINVDLGRLDEASKWATIARGDPGPFDSLWALHHATCAEVAWALGDRPWARRLRDAMAPFADNVVIAGQFSFGSMRHFLGMVAATLGELDEADAQFRAALDVEEALGAPVWAARTRVCWAVTLQRRGRGDDAARARALARQALEVARSLGALVVARDATTVLEHLERS
jgi:class 3 adenylate cyclase/tetratricopeptide (TPR) repeat protein